MRIALALLILLGSLSASAGEIDRLKLLAAQGDVDAQFKVGSAFDELMIFSEAKKWYGLAAEQGHVDALYQLGALYEYGLDGTQNGNRDYVEARKFYELAAQQGLLKAQNKLGNLLTQDSANIRDYSAAFKWYQSAAQRGHFNSQRHLGHMYEMGLGVAQDFKSAHMWYNVCAAQGLEQCASSRDELAASMTPADISEAQQMASDWIKAHP